MNVKNLWKGIFSAGLAVALLFGLVLPVGASRFFSSGFEMQSVAPNIEVTTASGTMTISTSTKRSGQASLRASSLISGSPQYVQQIGCSTTNCQTMNSPVTRFYFYVTTLPTANNRIFITNRTTDVGLALPKVMVELTSTGNLLLLDEDGAIGTSTTALATSTWYRVEVKLDRNATPDVVELKIDGVSEASSSARVISAGIAKMTFGSNLNSETQTQGDWYFDDIAHDNLDYPGAGSIVHLRPNGAGDNSNGTSTPGDNTAWSVLDETTPNDATDYWSLTTSTDILDVNLESSASAGIGSSDTINLVQGSTRATGATTATSTYSLRLKSESSGTVATSSENTFSTSTWWTNTTSTLSALLTSTTTPQTGGVWTPALLDTMQIGVQASSTFGTNLQISALWALVEYLPVSSNPAPTITSLSKSNYELTAGDADFTLTITGTGFVASTTATFGGSSKTVTYIGATSITIPITTADITAGTKEITVTNPTPGGGSASTNIIIDVARTGGGSGGNYTQATTGGYTPPAYVPPPTVSVTPVSPNPPVAPRFIFTKNLTLTVLTGTTDQRAVLEVKELQRYLNSQGFLVAILGAGSPGNETNYFGNLTKSALIRFQEAHAGVILNPIGLTKGTGYFGPMTRAFVNR